MLLVGRLLHRGTIVANAGIARHEEGLALGVGFSVAPAPLEGRFVPVALEIARAAGEWFERFPALLGLHLTGSSAGSSFTFPHRYVWVPRAVLLQWHAGDLDDACFEHEFADARIGNFESGSWYEPVSSGETWSIRPYLDRVPLLFRARALDCGVALDAVGVRQDRDGVLALYGEFGLDGLTARAVTECVLLVARCAVPFLRWYPALRLTVWTRPVEAVAVPAVSFDGADVIAWDEEALSSADLLSRRRGQ